jgi:hypothetical protein
MVGWVGGRSRCEESTSLHETSLREHERTDQQMRQVSG